MVRKSTIQNKNVPIDIIRASFLKEYILGIFPMDESYPFYPGVRYGLMKNRDIKFINSWKDIENNVSLTPSDAISFVRLRTSNLIYFSKPLLFSENYVEIMAHETLGYDPSFGERNRKNFKKFLISTANIVSNKYILPEYRCFPVFEKINGNYLINRIVINRKIEFYKLCEYISPIGRIISQEKTLISDEVLSKKIKEQIRLPWSR